MEANKHKKEKETKMNVIIALILIAIIIATGNRIIRAIWNWFMISETLQAYGIRTKYNSNDK